jgi:hypothetical protein
VPLRFGGITQKARIVDTNLIQVGGASIATGAGSLTNGTIRMVLAKDQPTVPVRVTNSDLPHLPQWSLSGATEAGPGDPVEFDGTFSEWAIQVVPGETTPDFEVAFEYSLDGNNWERSADTIVEAGVYRINAVAYMARANLLSAGGTEILVSAMISAAQA